jgi:hypothetical protein
MYFIVYKANAVQAYRGTTLDRIINAIFDKTHNSRDFTLHRTMIYIADKTNQLQRYCTKSQIPFLTKLINSRHTALHRIYVLLTTELISSTDIAQHRDTDKLYCCPWVFEAGVHFYTSAFGDEPRRMSKVTRFGKHVGWAFLGSLVWGRQ